MSPSPPIVLTFAASDPTGGAGLQADLLTLASMGCHPLSVVTALTMQDTRGVEGILAVEADWVAGQAKHLLEDMRVAAFKLGVLGSLENIRSRSEEHSLNSSHGYISYAVFCLKKKKKIRKHYD